MFIKKKREAPEKDGAKRLIKEMMLHCWKVHRLNVSAGTYSTPGFPDYYATHKIHGAKWIETKVPNGTLSSSQVERFKSFAEHNIGVWILFDEKDYPKLFDPPNWGKFLFGRL